MTAGKRVAALAFVAACGGIADREQLPPEGQIVIGIVTDAWLPRSAEDLRDAIPYAPSFERLRVEVYPPGETSPCDGCSRDFGIDHRTVDEGRASFGFIPRKHVAGYRARVLLYHSGPSESYADPRPRSSIETVIALPSVGDEGIARVHVVLRTDDLGRPRGTVDAPILPNDGPPPTGLAGTWHAEVRRDCAEEAREGEGCVPGGAFWMGDPGFAVPFERLVAISPFYVDLTEVRVGEFRSLLGTGRPDDLGPYDPTRGRTHCTFTTSPADKEEMPLNCVSRALAARICELKGGRLPTETEWEFLAGARRDATYPWGEATATCDDAVYGRSNDTTKPPEFRACVATKGIGPALSGSGALDRLRLPDGRVVVDLGGNLLEYVSDEHQTYGEPCLEENPSVDPRCRERSARSADVIIVRSSSWAESGGPTFRAAVRSTANTASVPFSSQIGLRCVRPSL